MSELSVEVNTDVSHAHRFPAWMALAVFSAVCLAALTSTTSSSGRDSAETWSLAVLCISLILSTLAVLAYLLMRAPFVSQLPEFVVLLLLTGFWGAGLPVLMNPKHNICLTNQQDEGIVIINANLYFFSWLSFAAILYLTGSCAQESAGYDVTSTPPQSARWYGLCASSVVVMGSAVRAYKSSLCKMSEFGGQEYCKRTKFAIAAGTCSFVISAVVTILIHQTAALQLPVETGFTTLLLVFWCFGVGYITFGNSPGATISNLFFGAWISFILAVFLFARNFREMIAARQGANNSTTGDTEAPVVTTTMATGNENDF